MSAPSSPARASQDANLAPPEELPLPPELVGLHQALPRGLSVRPFLCRAIAGERWHFRGSELLSQDPTAMPMAAPQPQGPRNSTSVLTHGASLAEGGARAPLSCSRRSSRLPSCVAVGWFFFRWEVKKSGYWERRTQPLAGPHLAGLHSIWHLDILRSLHPAKKRVFRPRSGPNINLLDEISDTPSRA